MLNASLRKSLNKYPFIDQILSSCNIHDYDSDDTIWNKISKFQPLSEQFIKEFQHYVNWEQICLYQTLSEDFIKEFSAKVDHVNIAIKKRRDSETKIKSKTEVKRQVRAFYGVSNQPDEGLVSLDDLYLFPENKLQIFNITGPRENDKVHFFIVDNTFYYYWRTADIGTGRMKQITIQGKSSTLSSHFTEFSKEPTFEKLKNLLNGKHSFLSLKNFSISNTLDSIKCFFISCLMFLFFIMIPISFISFFIVPILGVIMALITFFLYCCLQSKSLSCSGSTRKKRLTMR